MQEELNGAPGHTEGLRQLKKRRTRRALTDAAFRLFDVQGYETTTVAEIAAEAEVSTKTFFNYFSGKEAVVFYDAQARLEQALNEVAARGRNETPSALLGRAIGAALDRLLTGEGSMSAAHLQLWLQLLGTVPALQARGLRITFEVERRLAEALRQAFPARFDEVTAAAAVGAVVGAAQAAAGRVLESGGSPDAARGAVGRAVEISLRGIRTLDAGESPR